MTFAARPEERLFERPPKLGGRGRFVFILAICFLLHAIPLAFFLKQERPNEPAPAEQEIPVEVIAEPPPSPKEPEPPPPKQEQEKPVQPKRATLDEKIATDAPRAPNEEKLKDVKDEATHAPKTGPDSPPPAVAPASQAAPEKAIAPKPEEAAPQPMVVRDDGDPAKIAEKETPDPQDPAKMLEAALHPKPQPAPKQASATVFAALPDFSFTPLSRRANTAVGKAAETYLSVVYGMVLARGRVSEEAGARVQTTGDINFSIDSSGRLIRARIVKSCGAPDVDAAELAAIRAAAPFPPTPTGTALNLNLHFGK